MAKKSIGRFSALSELRAERSYEDLASESVDVDSLPKSKTVKSQTQSKSSTNEDLAKKSTKDAEAQNRGRGRPKGRRSNPDYTQISAYIPLDLLLGVQDALSEERRQKRQRTARPVSDLIEELLAGWLNTQQYENSDK